MSRRLFLLLAALVSVFSVGAVEAKSSTAPHPVKKTVIINEIMWMGSDKSDVDEWIELRNMTNEDINLKDYVIENAGSGRTLNIRIEGNKIIPANWFFLIANYPESSEKSALNVTVDLVEPAISLKNDGEQLTLKNPAGTIIDQTPAGEWAAGLDGPPLYKSMQRKRYPGNGTDPANWKTCTARMCHFVSYWDVLGINWGTPKASTL